GLTDLATPVGLWLRGQAVLVVENDDPDAVVRLAGLDEELRGTGTSEWTVPAGDHLLRTQRPSEPPSEEPVTLAAGRRHQAHAAPRRRPTPAADPFVLLSGGKERAFVSLPEAIGEARSGDTIEVRGNGPFVVPSIRLARALAIRAGVGYQPVFVPARQR